MSVSMNYPRHYTIDHYLKKVRAHSKPYTDQILEKEIIIFPGVMSPKYDRSSRIMISIMPTQEGKDVLEVGCGTGIISLFCYLQGAKSVTSLDINEVAVKNTEANFQKYQIKNGTVFLSDLFEKVGDKKFDTIIFNAPYHGNKAKDMLELGTSDHNYQTLQKFFKEVRSYFKENSRILLGFANTGDNDLLKKVIKENRFDIEELLTQENGDWTKYLYIIK